MSLKSQARSPWAVAVLMAAATLPAGALVIRTVNAPRHDRFTGFPGAPVLNPSSFYDGTRFTGLGWSASNPQRQFALISPRHFVMATHWGIASGEQINFLSSSGVVVTAIVDTTTAITEGANTCDLTFGRFTADIPGGSGVTPFPYLNVTNSMGSKNVTSGTNESRYQFSNLQVFGFDAQAGTGNLLAFQTEALSGSTRMYYFGYDTAGGDQDECYFIGGDSGSPTFALKADGTPMLVGTHSAVASDSGINYNFDTFVPRYIDQLNTLMAPDGYSMTEGYATSTSLAPGSTATTSPATLRRVAAGTASFTLQRGSTNAAANLVASLTFPSGMSPATVSGSGWTVDVAGPLVWKLHRASLSTNTTTTLTASWASVPAVSAIPVIMEWTSDGSQQRALEYDLVPAASYAEWSAPLAQPATTADPDSDGRTNLIEYAFGSDPSNGTNLLTAATPADTVMTVAAGSGTLRFPVRADSQIRGLSYVVEWSTDLAAWTSTAPSGTSIAYSAYSPAVSGFKESVITFPAAVTRRFARVKVTLNENAAGMVVP